MERSFHQPRIRSSRAGKLCPVSTARYWPAMCPPSRPRRTELVRCGGPFPPGAFARHRPPCTGEPLPPNKIRPAPRRACRRAGGATRRDGTSPAVPPYLVGRRRRHSTLSADACICAAARRALVAAAAPMAFHALPLLREGPVQVYLADRRLSARWRRDAPSFAPRTQRFSCSAGGSGMIFER